MFRTTHGDADGFPAPTGRNEVGAAVTAATEKLSGMRSQFIPRATAARDWARPRVEAAVEAAAPKVQEAMDMLGPKVDDAKDTMMGTWLPKIEGVVSSIAAAAGGSPARITDVLTSEDSAPRRGTHALRSPKRRSRARRMLGLGLVAAVAGAVYTYLKNRPPKDDPWATPLEDEPDLEAPAPKYLHTEAPLGAADDQGDGGDAASTSPVAAHEDTVSAGEGPLDEQPKGSVKSKVAAAAETAKEIGAETVETVKTKVTAATEAVAGKVESLHAQAARAAQEAEDAAAQGDEAAEAHAADEAAATDEAAAGRAPDA